MATHVQVNQTTSMNIKHNIWKYATLLCVILLFLLPEFVQLALFIDAAGLEIFVLLLEIQVIAILRETISMHKNRKFEFYNSAGSRLIRALAEQIMLQELKTFTITGQGPATVMHLLVIAGIAGTIIQV